MIRKLLWVAPLVLALSAVTTEAKPKPPKPTAAPEFDPRAAGAALAFLLGGAWVLAERLRRAPGRD